MLLALLGIAAAGCASAAPPRDPETGRVLPAAVRLPFEGHAQRHSLSCESRSAVDLLAFHGIHVDEDAFLAGLPRSDNPDLGFVGDVDGPGEQLPPAGYGVHADPVAARLTASGLPALATSGRDVAWLKARLAEGRPVIVWATASLATPRPVPFRDVGGRPFTAFRGEHTFVVVGYGAGDLWLADPATGAIRRVPEARFGPTWARAGGLAVVARQPR